MPDTLLTSLRSQLLDESEALAGLLRKCLLLGAETGSSSLRQWARYELNGYDADADLPQYRRLPTPVISVDSISGNTWAKNQTFHRLQLPAEAQKVVPEYLPLHQPVEELEKMSASKSLSFAGPGLAYAQTLWNNELGPFQQITGMSFKLSGSAISGVLGQVRTQLVDLIADLTADTPLAELPGKAQVDAAVGQHIGTQYVTTISSTNAPTAIGTKAKARSEGLSVGEVIELLDAVRAEADLVPSGASQVELLEVLEDLRVEILKAKPDTGAVVKKAGKLRTAALSVGMPALTAAVGGAVEALTSLAVAGAFG